MKREAFCPDVPAANKKGRVQQGTRPSCFVTVPAFEGPLEPTFFVGDVLVDEIFIGFREIDDPNFRAVLGSCPKCLRRYFPHHTVARV